MSSLSKLEAWEEKLFKILRNVDVELEQKYGDTLPLHPVRAPHGTTSNPQYDGLFRLTASYSAGYGSKLGPGYIFRVEFVTLEKVDESLRKTIENYAINRVKEDIDKVFLNVDLNVARDGNVIKIYGDLSLD